MLQLFNSLTRKKEEFKPISPPNVGMYTCGPTVYDFSSIGNFRTYVASDVLRRVLEFNDYKVKAVMNITDVGHLTGDGDLGEDKLARAAEEQKKTAWDIAKGYTESFLEDSKKLNIESADVQPKATDHIKEQIKLIHQLAEKGLTYKTSDGIYFNTVKYEEGGKKYGELSTLDEIKPGARVEKNPEKKDPRDFALWKFSEKPGERHMEWESPWGLGFPGWHIECSAMSMEYLGQSFDIHTGGEDLRQTHHPNEVAQSEGVTGKKFVNYWLHVTFLLVDGKRMGKSLDNAYTVSDIEKKGIDPLALRYLYLTAHYRDPLNFTWKGLEAAQNALKRLQLTVYSLQREKKETTHSKEKPEDFRKKFANALNDDLNTPQALAVVWDILKSNLPAGNKRNLILSFDKVLGLDLGRGQEDVQIPKEVEDLAVEREKLRKENKWDDADKVRKEIEKKGFVVGDAPDGSEIKRK